MKPVNWIRIYRADPEGLDFEMMCDPVTNEEYCRWLNSLGHDEARGHYCRLMASHFFGGIVEEAGGYRPKEGYGRKPVVFVSWYDAKAYSRWAGGRLPTADEWRFAAAWIPNGKRLARYATGSDSAPAQTEAVFYDFESGWALPAPHLADVDWHRPSGTFGLRGMAGNVAEWVDSETVGGWKLALGGSLFRPVSFLNTEAAEADHPSKRLSTFGFRIARDLP